MKAELALVGAGIVPDVRAASAKPAELYIVEVRLDQCALHVNFCRLGPLNKWRPPLIDAPVQEIFGKGLDPMMGEPSGSLRREARTARNITPASGRRSRKAVDLNRPNREESKLRTMT
jgi:hypothetical protein